jgi:hypothetical protein
MVRISNPLHKYKPGMIGWTGPEYRACYVQSKGICSVTPAQPESTGAFPVDYLLANSANRGGMDLLPPHRFFRWGGLGRGKFFNTIVRIIKHMENNYDDTLLGEYIEVLFKHTHEHAM